MEITIYIHKHKRNKARDTDCVVQVANIYLRIEVIKELESDDDVSNSQTHDVAREILIKD